MDAVIPWSRLIGLLEPALPQGRPSPSAAGAGEDAAHLHPAGVVQSLLTRRPQTRCDDSESMRRFARIELGEDLAPDARTILRLPPAVGAARADPGDLRWVQDLLKERRLLLCSGTIVDAPIIAAPSSTKPAVTSR
jgi:IS5 family transposase